jgi:hypothetical protein
VFVDGTDVGVSPGSSVRADYGDGVFVRAFSGMKTDVAERVHTVTVESETILLPWRGRGI